MFHVYLVERQANIIRPAYLPDGKPAVFEKFSAAQEYVRQCTNKQYGCMVEYRDK